MVVLPLQRCMALLRQDPRLRAVLPTVGAPLHWTVLVRPQGTSSRSPKLGLNEPWQPPLAIELLRDGWRSP